MNDDHPRIVLLWAGDSFEHVGEHPSGPLAHAFANGASEGGSYFGDGVSTFVLPDELADLEEWASDEFGPRFALTEWERVKEGLPAWATETGSQDK